MLRRNVLIFHAGALGDFVLAWPLALGLGRALAQSRITFITHQQKGLLAERVLRLESADIESGWHALHTQDSAPLPPRPTSLLAGAQAVYTFLSPSPPWLANVKRLTGNAKIVSLTTRPADGYGGHAVDWLLEQLADHPVERAATQQMLRSIAERGIGATAVKPSAAATGVDVLIHPGSGSAEKCWPLECFVELAARLKRHGRSVRFVIGEVERDRWDAGSLAKLGGVAEVREPTTYLDLLAEIQSARLVIGNDSGPAHLAGIVGTPTVAMFGPASSASQWKPLGPRVSAVSGPSWEALSVDAVTEAAIQCL
jgi:ADP-heptose:LPS heptosyltransferase